MKKIILAPILIMSLYANEDINTTQISKLSPEENMIQHPESFEKNYPRAKGYMPKIITPDDEKFGIYGGLALSLDSLKAKNTQFSLDNQMINLNLIAGYNLNNYLAFESRVSTSAAKDNGVDFATWSFFVKPKYELYNNMDLYTLIGFGGFDANSINSNKTKSKKTAFQLGLGANYKLGSNFKVFADYVYMGKDNKGKYNAVNSKVKSSAITTGITYDF